MYFFKYNILFVFWVAVLTLNAQHARITKVPETPLRYVPTACVESGKSVFSWQPIRYMEYYLDKDLMKDERINNCNALTSETKMILLDPITEKISSRELKTVYNLLYRSSAHEKVQCTTSADFNFKYDHERSSLVYFDPYQLYSENLKFYWDFGDGATSNHYRGQHQYQHPGTYYVTLVVSDVLTGYEKVMCDQVRIDDVIACDENILAGYFFNRDLDNANNYTFHAFGNLQQAKTSWFVDNVFVLESEKDLTYEFSEAGKHRVCLSVEEIEKSGCIREFCGDILVKESSAKNNYFSDRSIEEEKLKNEGFNFQLYPNPSSEILYVSLPASGNTKSIKIFNQNGQQVKLIDVINTGKEQMVDLSGLLNGYYTLEIYDSTGKATGSKPFIKS